MVAAAKHFV